MRIHFMGFVAIVALVAGENRVYAQQSVVLKAIGVNNCATGLPTSGVAGGPVALATDLNGHLCILSGGFSASGYGAEFPSAGMPIGVKDHTGTKFTHVKADEFNNLSTVLAGTLPPFSSPPAVSQFGTWNVGLTGPLPAFAVTPTFKIDQTSPGSTNLVHVGGALPSFAAPPAVTQSGAWVVGVSGTLPNFTSPPAVAQSGTWTVQPGNSPNTTPWLMTLSNGGNTASITAMNALKVDGSSATQPISVVSLPLPVGAATEAKQPSVASQGGPAFSNTGNLAFAQVLTSQPTYSPATTQPLRVNAAGELLVAMGQSASGNSNGVVITNASPLTVGGESAGTVASIGTAMTYSAGQSIGGLQTVSVFRVPVSGASPRSGTLARVRVGLKGTNQTPPLTVYVWEANPTASTCSDGVTFSSGAADWPALVDAFSVVPSAPTGTSMTHGYVDVAIPIINRDSPQNNNIYACIVTGASVALGANDLTLSLRVNQD